MTSLEFGRLLEECREEIAADIFAGVAGWTAEEISSDPDEQLIDVRLQVSVDEDAEEDGGAIMWSIHTGDSSYDQDHRGYWGAGGLAIPATLQDAVELTTVLIDDACEHFATSGEAE